MDRRDLDEIERFLTSVGRPTLFVYYGLDPSADAAATDEAVRKRRTWAQGQQSNPKFKSEALFLIKSNSLLKRVFVDALDDYRVHVRDDTQHRKMDVLGLFIRGTLASRELTPQSEAAILHQGRQLELSEAAVARRIEELLAETESTRVGFETADLSSETMAIDHYAILGVATDAGAPTIEETYRTRYRWARNLKDLKRSAEVLEALDEAWRILSDPARRVMYDERRLKMLEMTDEVEKRSAMLMGLLGGPTDALTGEAPLPGAPLPLGAPAPAAPMPLPPPVHEVGLRSATAPQGTRLPLAIGRPDSPPAAPPPAEMPSIKLAPRIDAPSGGRPAPPTITGRTIGITAGPQAVATLGPRLAVDGPEVLTLQVGGRPLSRAWTVRNAGQGKMPGRVVTDREWLQIDQPRLDPVAPSQTVTVHIVPQQVPWGRTAGTVTVVTDHGERRTVTVHVHRRSWLPLVGGVVALGFLGVAAVAAFLLLWPTPAAPTELALAVDPVADRVFVDGAPAGSGRALTIADPRDGKPFQLKVEADGFAPQEELVTLRPGERTTRTITLALVDDMTWAPPAEAARVDAPAPVRTALETAAAANLGACFAGVPEAEATATYTAWVTPDGQVRRVDVTDPSFPLAAAEPCIRRVFRGLRLPIFEGDHASVELRLAVPVTK